MDRSSVDRSLRAGILSLGLILAASSMGATTYTLSSSGGTGILAGNAVACTSVATCLGGTPDFDNLSLELASGSLSVVGGTTGTLSLSIPTLTLTGPGLGGVDEIVLSGLMVTFTGITVTETVLPGLTLVSQIPPAATATLTGTVEGLLGGSTVVGPMGLSETVSLSALNCTIPGQCGIQLDFTSTVGSPLEFRITANLNAVPEPELALLVALGLAATRARRRA